MMKATVQYHGEVTQAVLVVKIFILFLCLKFVIKLKNISPGELAKKVSTQ